MKAVFPPLTCMIKKILLIAPPIEDFYQTEIRLVPLGLGYLQASLKKWNSSLHVEILNLQTGFGKKTLSLPAPLSYLKNFWAQTDQSPFCGFFHYYRFGATNGQIVAEVTRRSPDLIGISALFTAYFPVVVDLLQQLRLHVHCPIVIGGPHASADPHGVLATPGVDYVIYGEGERPLVALVAALNGEGSMLAVPNLGHYYQGGMVFNVRQENFSLNDIPAPAPSAQHYYCGKKKMATMITSRSCPHRCHFCGVHTTFGDQYRRRSNESILAEITAHYRAGARLINFEDDNLSFSRTAFKELCRQIAQRFGHGNLELVAMNGISYQSLDWSTLELMRQAGFCRLNLSLVTNNKSVAQGQQQRFFSPDYYLQVVAWAQQLGFAITSYQILGLPGEGLSSMLETLALQARLPVIIGASPFYLIPNSPMARQLGVSGYLPSEQQLLVRLSTLTNACSSISRSQLYTLFMITRMLNFLKSLPFPDGAHYQQWIYQDHPSLPSRSQIGCQQLQRLAQERVLYFVCLPTWKPNEQFMVNMWEEFISQLEFIQSPSGNRLFFSEKPAILDSKNGKMED